MDPSHTAEAITLETQRLLVETAINIRKLGYAPYSNYQVGAAVLTESGQVFGGVNVENASFGGTICAERVAMCNAVAAGQQSLKAVAVATRDGGHPCGICRQFLAEFGWQAIVLVVHAETGEIVTRTLLSDLLPAAFLGRR